MKNISKNMNMNLKQKGRQLLVTFAIASMAITAVMGTPVVANAGTTGPQTSTTASVQTGNQPGNYETSFIGWGGCGGCGK